MIKELQNEKEFELMRLDRVLQAHYQYLHHFAIEVCRSQKPQEQLEANLYGIIPNTGLEQINKLIMRYHLGIQSQKVVHVIILTIHV